MLDGRRDVNIAQGIVVAVLTVVSIGWGWLAYRNVADALRSGFRGLVLALFTTGLFIMVMGILCQAQGTATAAVRRRTGIKITNPRDLDPWPGPCSCASLPAHCPVSPVSSCTPSPYDSMTAATQGR